MRTASALLLISLIFGGTGSAAETLSCEALTCSDKPEVASQAVQELRARGPEGLDVLFNKYELEVAELRARTASDAPLSSRAEKIRRVLDQVAQQKDAYSAGLYWYTDLGEARKAAEKADKPLLVLRMLGKLTDDCSCANSRFFRTALYANQKVSSYLKEHFILAWTSERPVPLITIDFGDGRKIERTITGNSVHYVLDSNGRVLDALPGLYGPGTFFNALQHIEALAKQTHAAPQNAELYIQSYHRSALTELSTQWAKAIKEIENAKAAQAAESGDKFPVAAKAAPLAETKCAVEMPMVRVLQGLNKLDAQTDEATWQELAKRYTADSKLDQDSFRLMRAKYPLAAQASQQSETKKKQETPLLKVLRNFQSSIALDTVKNEYRLHRQLHEWLLKPEARQSVYELNTRVYAELFLTPKEDPWLGLVPQDTYTALENEGLAGK